MDIKIQFIEIDNGDCELGCYNSAYGYEVTIDDVIFDELTPFCSCTSSKSFGEVDLVKLILQKAGVSGVSVRGIDSGCS